jgi:hypothetical protein
VAYRILYNPGEISSYGVSESISFARIRNVLGDGFESSVLMGSATGLREWSLKFDLMSERRTFTIEGRAQTIVEYLWDFYCEHQVSGEPFIIQSPKNNQFYLASFADEKLTLTKFTYKLWSTGLALRQRRVQNVTVFNTTLAGVWGWYEPSQAQSTGFWTDLSGNARDLQVNDLLVNHPTFTPNQLNGYGGVVWTSSKSPFEITAPLTFHHAFLVAKFGGAAFPSNGNQGDFPGLLSDKTVSTAGGLALLLGSPGATRFFDNNYDSVLNVEYRKNGISFPESAAEAPMNSFAVIEYSLINGSGFNLGGIQLGQDRELTQRRGAWTIVEAIICDKAKSVQDRREITEYLLIKYNLG